MFIGPACQVMVPRFTARAKAAFAVAFGQDRGTSRSAVISVRSSQCWYLER